MPIKKSAIKALRQDKKITQRNKKIQSDIVALVKRIRKSVANSDVSKSQEWLKQVVKKIDKAAQKGIIKKNAANRKKSRLSRLVQALGKKNKGGI